MQIIHIDKERLNAEISLEMGVELAEGVAQESGVCTLHAAASGGGILLPEMIHGPERYLSFYIEACTEHSVVLALRVYVRKNAAVTSDLDVKSTEVPEPSSGEKHVDEEAVFDVQFGILPGIRTPICIDRNWMDGHILFPESNAGQLKQVCHGRRVEPWEISRIVLETLPVYHDITLRISDMVLADEYPQFDELPDVCLVDAFGQNTRKEWPSKVRDLPDLKKKLERMEAECADGYPFADWSAWGGWKKKKLQEGTGFFTRCKAVEKVFTTDAGSDEAEAVGQISGKGRLAEPRVREDEQPLERWYLVDPDGYAFFSVGPDCVGLHPDCRVDGIEKWLTWLPGSGSALSDGYAGRQMPEGNDNTKNTGHKVPENNGFTEEVDRKLSKETDSTEKQSDFSGMSEDPVYEAMFSRMRGDRGKARESRRDGVMFSYGMANLYRALGSDWDARWQKMITGQLRYYGMNSIGNWSDQRLFGTTGMPYVTSLPGFPWTRQMIFRDFPDVLSEEYRESARTCAEALRDRKDDPWMIGYFLRNEPEWAFVDHLVLADEVLYQSADTVCKERLIAFLREKYEEIENLNQAYGCDLKSFDEFRTPRERVSQWSPAAEADMKEFSRILLRAYVEIPCQACRAVDPNHMILGMRWAWISDPDLVTGWENFDVFSINCYAVDPTASLNHVTELGVDLPILIGEFHFGALDAGPTATGLEGVASQKDRGIAYRYYCERVAAHPAGVGCHYFQCYDQFALGRFDGENYNIGLFDICSQPYPEMLDAVRRCSESIYLVMEHTQETTEEKAVSIPMIAY